MVFLFVSEVLLALSAASKADHKVNFGKFLGHSAHFDLDFDDLVVGFGAVVLVQKALLAAFVVDAVAGKCLD